jgi:hypothetical protein
VNASSISAISKFVVNLFCPTPSTTVSKGFFKRNPSAYSMV